MIIETKSGKFDLVNEEKAARAKLKADKDQDLLLAVYDSYAGLILNEEEDKVATGSFWDFKLGKPKEVPEVKKDKKYNKELVAELKTKKKK